MGVKILIIEDDPDTRRALGVRLRGAGYDVATASDAQSAIATVQRERPQGIVLDLGIPGGGGVAVLERLEGLGLRGVVPVVVVTARAVGPEHERALAHGAVAVLSKPVDNAALVASLERHVGKPQPHAGAGSEPPAPRRKVLLVEDDADTRLGLAIRLQASGFDVVQVTDGATAMTRVVKERPDAIVLDLGLPGGDGMSVLERLKRNASTEAIPVVVLSARDPAANRPKALAAGAAAFLQKPPDNARLLDVLRSVMADR